VVVTNSSGSTTLTKLIAVNNANPGGGTCPAPTSSNVYLSYLSPSGGGCSSASPSAPCTPNEALSFAVNASGYSIGCGTHTYSWSFDDGGSSNSRTPTHAFTAQRTYNVSCTITNPGGNTTLTIPVIVGSGSGGGPDVQVDFGYEAVPGAPMLIKFTPSVVPANSVSSWKWNFGDNSAEVPISGTSVIPQYHQYANSGTYTVVLTTNAGVVTKQVVVGGSTTPRWRPVRH
jgi:PKD repeat protein